MENRVVCYYCGTIYEAEEEKCPLCGGKTLVKEDEVHQPVQRRRITAEERKQRQRAAKGGKYAASNKNRKEPKEKETSKTLLIAALVFLALAVVVVTWFIGDMIGWWGGLEDSVDRGEQSVSINTNESCSFMELSDSKIHLLQIGETYELKFTVNVNCNDKIEITWPDANIALATANGDSIIEEEYKTDSWIITAVADGTTKIEFRCGEYLQSCEIVVGEETVEDLTSEAGSEEQIVLPDDFEPELNFTEDISLYYKGETLPLSVVNQPQGATVEWTSTDETVAKVDENGLVTAISNGTTNIVANVGGKIAEITVRCPFDESGNIDAHLSHTDVTIKVGESFRLYLLDSNNERITDVTYTMSKEGVCTVEDGKVTGVKGGTNVTITITYQTYTYECIVRVRG